MFFIKFLHILMPRYRLCLPDAATDEVWNWEAFDPCKCISPPPPDTDGDVRYLPFDFLCILVRNAERLVEEEEENPPGAFKPAKH